MTDPYVTTAFHFVCEYCHAGNDYRHRHGPSIQPYLVTRRCENCHRINQLGFLLGTPVDPETDSDEAPVGEVDLPPLGKG